MSSGSALSVVVGQGGCRGGRKASTRFGRYTCSLRAVAVQTVSSAASATHTRPSAHRFLLALALTDACHPRTRPCRRRACPHRLCPEKAGRAHVAPSRRALPPPPSAHHTPNFPPSPLPRPRRQVIHKAYTNTPQGARGHRHRARHQERWPPTLFWSGRGKPLASLPPSSSS